MREIIKRIAIAFTLMVVIALCQSAEAQTTTVTATVRDRTNALVTSGQVTFEEIPNALTTDGVSIFTANKVTCTINGSGLLKALDGVSACVITYNTLTTPAGTYYRVTFFPNFGRTAVMNFFAFQASQDLSTIVPTPGTMPVFSFVDLVTTQTISGNKTFSGTNTFSGVNTFSAANTFSAVNTFSAIPVFTAGISGTAGQTLALPSAAGTLASNNNTLTFTGKTFDTAGSGNIFKIAGSLVSAVTGTGSTAVMSVGPAISNAALTTPAIGGGSTINGIFRVTTAALNFGTITAQSETDLTFTVTGAATSGTAWCSPTTNLNNGIFVWDAFVSSTNNVTLRVNNVSAGNSAPQVVTWNCAVIQ